MKRLIKCLAGFLMCLCITLSLTACDFWNKKKASDFEVTAEISFAKNGDKTEFFDTDEFYVGTKIYVCVDFTIKKNYEKEEKLVFEVEIPCVEYYSLKDFYGGEIKPNEDEDTTDANGFHIKRMSVEFVFDDTEKHEYHYIFAVAANQPCEDAEFEVRFNQRNYNLKVSVNGDKIDNRVLATYTFIAQEN